MQQQTQKETQTAEIHVISTQNTENELKKSEWSDIGQLKNQEINYNSLDINDLEGEEWRDIPEYEGIYKISNYGRIKSLPKILKNGNSSCFLRKERVLACRINQEVKFITLCKNNKDHKNFPIHLLMANIFLNNNEKYLQVSWKDGNKSNNCLQNLELLQENELKDLENENWQDIPNYEGLYQASNYGRLKAFRNNGYKLNNGNLIKIVDGYEENGYKKVNLIKDSKLKAFWLHTLIAKIFIPNSEGYLYVSHKNCNKLDNKVENLEWCGRKLNEFETIDGEIWKDIPGYEGLYRASNFGRIYSSRRTNQGRHGSYQTGRILSQLSNNGYKRLKLTDKNGKTKGYVVHRLIALTFIPNIESKPFINHKDLNRSNNHVDNLEWVTPKENIDHACQNKNKDIHYYSEERFTISDILNIKKLINKKKFGYKRVAELYKTSVQNIKHIIK